MMERVALSAGRCGSEYVEYSKTTDLQKMKISIYAIKVGQSTIEKLNFNNEFEIEENFSKKDNPEYEKKKKKVEDTSVEKLLDIYDVLLAGVESDD